MVSNRPHTIAIDGPAASGKSTVGQLVAHRLGFLYVDTGAMYRAITLLALERGMDLSDEVALGRLAAATRIDIEAPAEGDDDERQYTVRVGGKDITWEIRHHLVDAHVSQVAAHPAVRAALVAQQRRIGLRGNVVMVGRDIGTVVMPDAPLKIYLDASLEERVRRRYDECQRRGRAADYQALFGAMQERDRKDSSRAHSPLRPAEDAYRINSSDLAIGAVVETILSLAGEVFELDRRTVVR
ncbi:MAG: (d)CMP kinase [Ardenticatenaceae bacterium]